MSACELQLNDPPAPQVEACWNEIGVQGDTSCSRLEEVIHCHNCPTYSKAGVQLLDRALLPDYRHAWTEHFAQEKTLPAPAKTSAVLFRIGAEWLALPTEAFQEVADRRLVHSLPHRRQSIVLGLVNVRGELLICVSLARLLGLDKPPTPETSRPTYDWLLIVNWESHRFVFPADEVRGIHHFQTPELKEPPATLGKSGLSHTRGVLNWQGRSVGLLDPDLLFSSVNRSLT